MKASFGPRDSGRSCITRRQFLATGSTCAVVASVVPAAVLGRGGDLSPNSRLNIAFVGVGSQGLRVMIEFLKQPDVQGVAVCDPVRSAADYPQWGQSEFANAVHRLLGVSSGWEWLSPNSPMIQLTPTQSVPAGVAGREPCQKIVNAWNAKRIGTTNYRGCSAYADYRELLDKERDIDAVVVGTTDVLHAPVAIAAMLRKKHVYCQKPMAHSIHAARRMAELATETGVATQVAVGTQATEDTRRLCEWIAAGAIGKVREVINWSNRPVWPQGLPTPSKGEPVPEGLDWDLWLGPAPERPYHHCYLPFVWRGWYDFGCGAIGDMGCYSIDIIYRALKLNPPVAAQGSSSERFPDSFPKACAIHLEFSAREDMPPVKLHWYDGGLLPERPTGWEEDSPMPAEGMMFIGDDGILHCGFTGGQMRLIPKAKMQSFKEPPKTLPRSPGNEREWLDACKGGKNRPGAEFVHSAAVTEALLLGNIAVRTGERVRWNSKAMKLTGSEAAQALVHPPARSGWLL
ncbi:MAG: Gfo/Idh/MocA family oxidoreductase [Verrucomicrobia bacterium]|nr:Gfo/Idh/MocA family oxidoreductase [Verrucomicrobiota bacterium]